MNEKPLERLNFFNGQRLQAEDFRLEQDYHIRVRRWLNRSLYTAGIASGLEVRKVPGAPSVIVSSGLALDGFGREIILLDEQPCPLHGSGTRYLTIRYGELTTSRQDACCSGSNGAQNHTVSGGPSRVLAEPVLEWSDRLPNEEAGKVLLARVKLGKGCREIAELDSSIRHYVGAASAAKVRQYALEGFRDIDERNSGKIYFHVRGRQPTTITLYLRSEELPTLYYTEMGHHVHSLSVDLSLPPHTHKLFVAPNPAETGPHKVIVNGVTANADKNVWDGVIGLVVAANPLVGLGGLALKEALDKVVPGSTMNLTLSPQPFSSHNGDDLVARVNMNVDIDDANGHVHAMPAATQPFPESGNSQSLQGGGTGTSGAAGVSSTQITHAARSGAPIRWVDDLQIAIGSAVTGSVVDKTEDIRQQIANSRPLEEDWSKLGQGLGPLALDSRTNQPLDPLSAIGSGAIRLDLLPTLSFGEGEYVIELSAPAGRNNTPNGGRIHYNLYIE